MTNRQIAPVAEPRRTNPQLLSADRPVAGGDIRPPGGGVDYRPEVSSAGYSKPSSSRSVMYLTITGAETCGMSLSGPILLSCTAARKWSVGASDLLIGCSGFW